LNRAGDFLTYDGSHRTADETVFHGGNDNRIAVNRSLSIDYGLINANLRRKRFDALFIGLVRLEFQWVGRTQRGILLRPTIVQKRIQALDRADLVMVAALRTNLHVCGEILLPKRLLATSAFDPQAFSPNDARVFGRLHRLFLSFEPSHNEWIYFSF